MIELFEGDCLTVLPTIPNKSVDLVLTDLPYGITDAPWDTPINLEQLWPQLRRVIKPKCAMLMFSNQPFTTDLIASNRKEYRHIWYWEKSRPNGHLNCNSAPMRCVEEILVFGKSVRYLPQLEKRDKPRMVGCGSGRPSSLYNTSCLPLRLSDVKYPRNLLRFGSASYKGHPTVKPIPLLEYLIKTYSLEGETVLDVAMGSGSTGVACKNTNRNFIGIEINKDFFELAKNRIHP